MPLLIDDWRTSRRIACMDAWEERAYLRILMECWDSADGWIPADDDMLSVVSRCGARWKKCKEKVLACFEVVDGRLSHPKVQELRTEADAVSEARKRSATSRWQSSEQASTRSQRLREAREKGTHTREEFDALLLFCGRRCVKCGSDGNGRGGMVKDHVTPIYQGGSDGIDNIQPLCGTCNASKGPDTTDYLADRRLEFERLQMHCKTSASGRRSTPANDCYSQPQSQSHTQETQAPPQPPSGGRSASAAVDVPEWVPREPWLAYCEMRVKIRKPMTRRAAELAIAKLAELRGSGQDPGAVLDQSVLNSWQGLFPLKTEEVHGKSRSERNAEAGRRALEILEERDRARAAGTG